MTAPAKVVTCPIWCSGDHDESDTFHYQRPAGVGSNIGELKVYASFDERSGQFLVNVGENEMTAEQARHLARILDATADLRP